MSLNKFDLQPNLKNDFVAVKPLKETDFDILYSVASDPLIWEQHPNKERYKKEVFTEFFKGALESKGAFLVFDSKTNQVIGSSRFYDFNENDKSIFIGYTFLAKDHWGSNYNQVLKSLMLNHAFQFVDNVYFHIGANNLRSQKSIERLGAEKIGQEEISYYGEGKKLNFTYLINREIMFNSIIFRI